jgi:hypothetical protein
LERHVLWGGEVAVVAVGLPVLAEVVGAAVVD